MTYARKIRRLYTRETRRILSPLALILAGLWLVAMAVLFTLS